MKIEKKHLFIILFCTILLFLLIFSLININLNKKTPVISFYGLEDKVVEAIKSSFDKNANSYFSNPEQKYKYLIFDSEQPLKKQLEERNDVAVVFSYNGESQKSISENALKINKNALNIMPTSMRNASNNSFPLLLNHLEMSVYNKTFVSFGKNEIVSLENVLKLGEKELLSENFNAIMTVFGNNDKVLSYFLSAYIESRYGVEELNKINNFLSQNQYLNDKENIFDFPELKYLESVCKELVELKKMGIFHSEWDVMAFDDIKNFMESKKVAFVFMDLNTHRNIPYNIIKNYSESFFPSGRLQDFGVGRSLIVPTVMATCFETTNEIASKECMQIVENMISLEEQVILARNSGYAPVASSAETQDKQAYNVRLWAASADSIAMDLGSSFTDPVARKAFFAELRKIL